MTDPNRDPAMPDHDEMLAEIRRLIVVCANNATDAADVLAVAQLLTAYVAAVEHPHWRPAT